MNSNAPTSPAGEPARPTPTFAGLDAGALARWAIEQSARVHCGLAPFAAASIAPDRDRLGPDESAESEADRQAWLRSLERTAADFARAAVRLERQIVKGKEGAAHA